jgi:hypothetical protein
LPRVSRRVGGKILPAEERGSDHGTDGPAQLARSYEIREWKVTGTTAKRMNPDKHPETYPLDHYERGAVLDERQLFAMRRLALNFGRGFGRPRLVARLIGGGGTLSDDRAQTQSQCRAAWADAMAAVPHDARSTLIEVVLGQWPTRVNALTYLRIGADAVADHWKFARVVTGSSGEDT